MSKRSKFSEEQLIALFHEQITIDVIAKRENVSRLSLIARWRHLQRRGRVPFERMGAPIDVEPEPQVAVEPAAHWPHPDPTQSYDTDGRFSVNALSGDDWLLQELLAVHKGPPGAVEYTPALDLPAEKYRESPRNRQQTRQQQKHR